MKREDQGRVVGLREVEVSDLVWVWAVGQGEHWWRGSGLTKRAYAAGRQLQAHVRSPRGINHDGLPGPAPPQVHQSAHRKDGGEEPGYAEREEYPNEEGRVGSGEGVGNASCPH